jgi:hypothetical protein
MRGLKYYFLITIFRRAEFLNIFSTIKYTKPLALMSAVRRFCVALK